MATERQTKARARHLKRRAARARRTPKGRRGYTPRGFTREDRSKLRHVSRKLKAGRPGRLSNAPLPAFDWEKVVNDSQRVWRRG